VCCCYEVLNDQGRVTKVIPPAPTGAELERILADKARASSDAQLLRLYSTPDDVERARQRKLAELDGLIGVARGNLKSVRTQQANLQSQAADQERAGRAVPAHLLAQIDNQKAEQERLKADIVRYQAARKDADISFNADRDRLAELLSRQ
jgi:septal ring factor EnvC (AmiA/AmiB activator)